MNPLGIQGDGRRQLLTDFLASFTYIPGTVLHVGYGSLYEKVQWQDDRSDHVSAAQGIGGGMPAQSG